MGEAVYDALRIGKNRAYLVVGARLLAQNTPYIGAQLDLFRGVFHIGARAGPGLYSADLTLRLIDLPG